MKGISVVICCYNSASRIKEVLKHLAAQEVAMGVNWEIIVVDNNSKDNTALIARQYWDELSHPIEMKIVVEQKPGLSFAREAGVANSRYELILFCDDDNLLSKNYLQSMFNLLAANNTIGIAGAVSKPLYESEPPNWFTENEKMFALGSLSPISTDVTLKPGWVWGAGMVIRRTVLEKIKASGYKQFLTDRVGSKMTTGGDVELCKAAVRLGYAIWFNTDCHFYHIMDTRRFNFEKFLDLIYQNAKNNSYFRLFKVKDITIYMLTKRIIMGVFKIPLITALKYCIKINIDPKNLQKLKWSLGSIMGNMLVLIHLKELKANIKQLR